MTKMITKILRRRRKEKQERVMKTTELKINHHRHQQRTYIIYIITQTHTLIHKQQTYMNTHSTHIFEIFFKNEPSMFLYSIY